MIRFNGIDFSEFNTFWDGSQLFDKPEKDVTFISVLGRNGDLTISNDRYKNLQIKVNCFIRTNFEENFSNLINFLTSVDGYARFESSEEPYTYRMATYVRAIQPKTTPFNKGGFFTLVFDCKPQRFLYEGEVPVSVENINSTRTGTLISLEDTENTTSITDAKAELEPKVYHDYDSVWLPGYGKNKLRTTATEETVNGLTFSPNDDGTIEVSGTSSEALTVTTDSEIYSKRVVENGYRLFDELVGGSIVWNQLANNASAPTSRNGLTITRGVDDFTINGTATASTTATGWFKLHTTDEPYQNLNGHKVLVSLNLLSGTVSSANAVYFTLGGSTALVYSASPKIVVPNIGSGSTCAFHVDNGTVLTNAKYCIQVTDLTKLFSNSSIADYIYNLEQSNSGSGVAFFKKLFNEDYYAYNSGTIMSVSTNAHEMVGFNQWDEVWESGEILSTNGQNTDSTTTWRSTNYIPIFPNTEYYAYSPTASNQYIRTRFYDANKEYIGADPQSGTSRTNSTFVTPSNAYFMRIAPKNNTIPNHDICINISNASMNGTYEPYQKNTYSLSPLTLRGIPKLDNNKIVYSGDIYKSDGTVSRHYGEVDLGTLNWTAENNRARATIPNMATPSATHLLAEAMAEKYTQVTASSTLASGQFYIIRDTNYNIVVYYDGTNPPSGKLVYALADYTTETATAYTKPQICEQGGTEEYVDYEVTQGNRDVSIPVGHNTFYCDYVVSDEAKLTEGETYNVSDNLTAGYRDSSGMHTVTNSLTIPQGGEYEFSAYTGDGASIEPMISTSSTTPFEPYENIGYLEEYGSATLKIEPKNIYPLANGMEYDSGMFIQINEGEVRISGNATSRTVHALGNVVNVTNTYIASGGIAEGNSKLIVRKINTVMGHSTVTDYDIYTEDVTIPVSRLGTTTLQFFLDIANGSGDGLLFKPMLRNSLITDSTFEKGVDGSTTELCLFDPATTGGEYSFYYRTLTETYKAIDISTLTWSIATTRGELTVFTATLPSTADVSVNVSNHYCTGMAVAYGLQSNAQEAKFTIYKSGNTQSSAVYLAYKTSEVPDVSTLTSLIDGIYLNYKLYTPVTTNYGPEGAIYPIENATSYFYSPYQPSDLSSIVDYHELEISYTSPTVIENPTGMKAYPLIQIVPTDDTNGYVRINGATIFVKMNGVLNHGVYFFDTEIQDAYWGDYENANAWIYTLSPEIFFKEGKNVVTFENVDRVVIYPRWWKL